MPRVLLVCSGLDHARRGYETFARECFEALRHEPGIRLELVKGSGPPGPGERHVPTLRRDHRVARALGHRLGVQPFRLEALAFALSLQPLIAARRPELIYLSEWDTTRGLAALRRVSGQRFRLLLCNGGFATHFEHVDHVQELTPAGRDHVLNLGSPPEKHTMLPLGMDIPPAPPAAESARRQELRRRHGLPAQRQIVISVAALNRYHKRLDYLIEEFAALPPPRPLLLMVGQPEAETEGLRQLAARRLPGDHEFRTVAPAEVAPLLQSCDAFVLASVAEMQGRALIEAAAQGLPCLGHDSPIIRFALGDTGFLADLQRPGSLTARLREVLELDEEHRRRIAAEGHAHVYARFSWDRLRPEYVRLLQLAAST